MSAGRRIPDNFAIVIDRQPRFLDIAKSKGDVLVYCHIRPKGVILEKKTHSSFIGRNIDPCITVKDSHTVYRNFACSRCLKTGNHPKSSGFTAAGWTQQSDKGVILYNQVQVINRIKAAPSLGNMRKFNSCHILSSSL